MLYGIVVIAVLRHLLHSESCDGSSLNLALRRGPYALWPMVTPTAGRRVTPIDPVGRTVTPTAGRVDSADNVVRSNTDRLVEITPTAEMVTPTIG
ncbi:hypothetical protein CALVIDRAFT_121527 [Calocera viscosa TUFC12733]|uniref:Secreted protein n=1 Tax=Calocera viscosa (strain TUFC12733) TaxID=1330018 RepID=A0A167RLP1_CALVF|nr:hypothetical protein CALVIDRAFT_121527 [Calocera viscosa TUFC12733]